MLTIADPGFTVEPPRWPYAYARTVTLASDPARDDPFLKITLNADSLGKLLVRHHQERRGTHCRRERRQAASELSS